VRDGDSGDHPDRDDAVEHRLRELSAEISATAHRAAQAAKRETHVHKESPQRSGHSRPRTASLIAVALLIAGGLITWGLSSSSTNAVNDTNPVRNGPVPTGSARTVASGVPADAFAGTPADRWPDGAAGIVVPAARPDSEFTASQVTAAYQITRKILVAANLDWPTLRGGAPTAFADLLSPQQRAYFISDLDKTGQRDGILLGSRGLVMSFAPGTTSFVTDVVKVHGSMSAGTTVFLGRTALSVKVNYLLTYAVEPPGHPADWMRIVAHKYGYVYFAQWDDPGGPLEPWVYTETSSAGGQCGMTDGYIHPAYPNGARSSVQPSGQPVNPYSMAHQPASSNNTCYRSTGT
jgi:hypothetical protein